MTLEEYTCSLFDCSVDELFTPSRRREVVFARQVCMWLMRKSTNASNTMIGEYFGRHRTTATAAATAFQNNYDTDRYFREAADKAKREKLDIPFTASDIIYSGCTIEDDYMLIP